MAALDYLAKRRRYANCSINEVLKLGKLSMWVTSFVISKPPNQLVCRLSPSAGVLPVGII